MVNGKKLSLHLRCNGEANNTIIIAVIFKDLFTLQNANNRQRPKRLKK